MKRKTSVLDVALTAILTLLALFWLYPLVMAFLNSFKSNGELLTNVVSFPTTLRFDNYLRTLNKMHYLRSLLNTAFLAACAVGAIVLISSAAGWRMCRTKTRFSRFLFGLFVFSMLIPFSSIMIPLFRVVLFLGIKSSLAGLAAVYAGTGTSMAIFLYHGFVKGIPYELEEAATIDGCHSVQLLFRIVLPMLKPITATIVITNVLWIWNDFLLPLIVLGDNRKYTLLLSTNTLFGQYSNDWSAILCALILAAVPVVLFYGVFQKQILRGISEGALKG